MYNYDRIIKGKNNGTLDYDGDKEKRFNFVKKYSNKNAICLIDVKETKENIEIIHVHWINNEKLKSLYRKK